MSLRQLARAHTEARIIGARALKTLWRHLKGFLKSISQVCFDDFAVKVINIESRSPTKIEKIVWHLLDSRVGVKHESS